MSHRNIVVDDHRTGVNADTINARLHIAFHALETAHYDPRMAIAQFLSARKRREREPSADIYSQRFCEEIFKKRRSFF